MESYGYTISASPHIHSGDNTRHTMQMVCLSLCPPLLAGTLFFGFRALLLTAISIVCAAGFEALYRVLFKQEQTIDDFSAVVTGMLLALSVPVTYSIPLLILGDFIAIVLVKNLFGGLGRNFLNPAITARIFLLLLNWDQMKSAVVPFGWISGNPVATATPLSSHGAAGYLDLFTGNVGGVLGETSALAILIGFAILLFTRVIQPSTTLAFLGSAALFSLTFGFNPAYTLLSGGLLFGAVYMATDYTTSAYTLPGQLFFGLGCGMITMIFRSQIVDGFPEGVSFAIILMNICILFFRKITPPIPFGADPSRYRKDRILQISVLSLFGILAIVFALITYL